VTKPRRCSRAPAILHVDVELLMIGLPLTVDPELTSGRAVLVSNCKADQRPSRCHAERPLIERLTLRATLAQLRRLR
jgi:hypothetical protein